MFSRKRIRTYSAILAILFWILLGTFLFFFLEDWTLIDSFYFSVTSLTTVGYGDLTPSTQLSKLIAGIYILCGVGTVLASLGILSRDLLHKEEVRLERRYTKRMHEKLLRRKD